MTTLDTFYVNPAVSAKFSVKKLESISCYAFCHRCFDVDIANFSGLVKARILGFRFSVSHDKCRKRSMRVTLLTFKRL